MATTLPVARTRRTAAEPAREALEYVPAAATREHPVPVGATVAQRPWAVPAPRAVDILGPATVHGPTEVPLPAPGPLPPAGTIRPAIRAGRGPMPEAGAAVRQAPWPVAAAPLEVRVSQGPTAPGPALVHVAASALGQDPLPEGLAAAVASGRPATVRAGDGPVPRAVDGPTEVAALALVVAPVPSGRRVRLDAGPSGPLPAARRPVAGRLPPVGQVACPARGRPLVEQAGAIPTGQDPVVVRALAAALPAGPAPTAGAVHALGPAPVVATGLFLALLRPLAAPLVLPAPPVRRATSVRGRRHGPVLRCAVAALPAEAAPGLEAARLVTASPSLGPLPEEAGVPTLREHPLSAGLLAARVRAGTAPTAGAADGAGPVPLDAAAKLAPAFAGPLAALRLPTRGVATVGRADGPEVGLPQAAFRPVPGPGLEAVGTVPPVALTGAAVVEARTILARLDPLVATVVAARVGAGATAARAAVHSLGLAAVDGAAEVAVPHGPAAPAAEAGVDARVVPPAVRPLGRGAEAVPRGAPTVEVPLAPRGPHPVAAVPTGLLAAGVAVPGVPAVRAVHVVVPLAQVSATGALAAAAVALPGAPRLVGPVAAATGATGPPRATATDPGVGRPLVGEAETVGAKGAVRAPRAPRASRALLVRAVVVRTAGRAGRPVPAAVPEARLSEAAVPRLVAVRTVRAVLPGAQVAARHARLATGGPARE